MTIDPARDLLFCGDVVLRQNGAATATHVTAAWRDFVLGQGERGAVLLVRSVARARRALLQTLCATGDSVVLPANASYELVESVKRAKIKPTFANLDRQLHLAPAKAVAVAWAEAMAGLPTGCTGATERLVIDYADSAPAGQLTAIPADVLLFGLHLAPQAEEAGALLLFRDAGLAQAVSARLRAADEPDWARAAWQLQRLLYHAPRHQQVLAQMHHALHAAAGLPLLPLTNAPAIVQGVAVQIPAECATSTFYHYALGENTPVNWLPLLRPLHPAAAARGLTTAAHLERWVLAPLGLTTTVEMMEQTVLGLVKAAEYLGVRWRTTPQRAAAYAALLTERYGPDHDAYRPAFATAPTSIFEQPEFFDDFAPLACRVG
jgi:hypothetical protein